MTQALIDFDNAMPLSPTTDLLVELWPRRGATGLMVHWDTRTASLVPGCPDIVMAVPMAKTPQGSILGAHVIACQQRHGASAFFAPDGRAFCHACDSPFLWVVSWRQRDEGGS
jgi:hypothetical protein